MKKIDKTELKTEYKKLISSDKKFMDILLILATMSGLYGLFASPLLNQLVMFIVAGILLLIRSFVEIVSLGLRLLQIFEVVTFDEIITK